MVVVLAHLYLVVDITSDKTVLVSGLHPAVRPGLHPVQVLPACPAPAQQHLPSPPSSLLTPPSHLVITRSEVSSQLLDDFH